jgi:hypothetical protein
MKLAGLFKGKVLVAVLLSSMVASSKTAVFAASPAGQAALQRDGHHASGHKVAERKSSTYPGLPEAQQATEKNISIAGRKQASGGHHQECTRPIKLVEFC